MPSQAMPPWGMINFLGHVFALIQSRPIKRVYAYSGVIPPVDEKASWPTLLSPQKRGWKTVKRDGKTVRLRRGGKTVLQMAYQAMRRRAYSTVHTEYRKLIDTLKAIESSASVRGRAENEQEKIERANRAGGLVMRAERLICEMVAQHRTLLEDPVILGYWRASTVAKNDPFFSRLGEALQQKTAPHARSKEMEAIWIQAQLDAGIPWERVVEFDPGRPLKKVIENGRPVSKDAARKLLKRHRVNPRSNKEVAARETLGNYFKRLPQKKEKAALKAEFTKQRERHRPKKTGHKKVNSLSI
jgi:hypothetical protein